MGALYGINLLQFVPGLQLLQLIPAAERGNGITQWKYYQSHRFNVVFEDWMKIMWENGRGRKIFKYHRLLWAEQNFLPLSFGWFKPLFYYYWNGCCGDPHRFVNTDFNSTPLKNVYLIMHRIRYDASTLRQLSLKIVFDHLSVYVSNLISMHGCDLTTAVLDHVNYSNCLAGPNGIHIIRT